MSSSTSSSSAPAEGSSDLQLYSLATPNGQKIGILLEELKVPYDAHTINISANVQFEDWFKKINPNSKIPALVDKNGPDGKRIALFESGAILFYLAEKYKKFLPSSAAGRYETMAWVFWQVGGLGPMSGQMNHFVIFAKDQIPYAQERYKTETNRLLGVMDGQLSKTTYLVGDEYTIADIASFGWVNFLFNQEKYKGVLEERVNLKRWWELIRSRPAVQKGLTVCKPS